MRLTPLETLLNRSIASSSTARELCRRLDGKVLAVHLQLQLRATAAEATAAQDPQAPAGTFSLYFRALGERMSLDTRSEAAPNASLSGTPWALLRLTGPAPEAALRSGAVHIQGDAEVAQNFSELLDQARPDLEEELSRLIGDIAAHQIGRAARSALSFARRAADTFAQNVSEYLQEEGRDVPSRTEAEEFLGGVDTLREDVDRFEARLALLERRRPH